MGDCRDSEAEERSGKSGALNNVDGQKRCCKGFPVRLGLPGPGTAECCPVIQQQSPLLQHVLILHHVADYAAWKKVFDAAAGIRKAAGERTWQVLHLQNDPNRIVHFSTWTSHEAARAFFESPELVRIRAEAGVESPEFIYLQELEAGTL
jgi:quinol monooxygenase YgiN